MARVLIPYFCSCKLMDGNETENWIMSRARSGKLPVLERNELRNEDFPTLKPLRPVSKFGQVLFFYFPTNMEGGRLKIEVDQSNRVAVVCEVAP